jgi:hypothetical protein
MRYLKKFYTCWTSIGPDSSGREMSTKRSTCWQNGELFVDRRTKVG